MPRREVDDGTLVAVDSTGSVTPQAIARALRDLRAHAGLKQIELAKRAEWPTSVVARLETAHDFLPDLASVARYARACALEAGLVFATPDGGVLQVHSALTLQSARHSSPYEVFQGAQIAVPSAEDRSGGE